MSDFGPPDVRKAVCYNCLGAKRVDTLFEKTVDWDDGFTMQGTNNYYVFQCRGCETIFFCRSSADSEDFEVYYDPIAGKEVKRHPWSVDYFPKIPRAAVERIPLMSLMVRHSRTADLLREVYAAIDNDLMTLAAIGTRTTFDSASEHLGIDPDLPFNDKLEALRKQGFISGKEKGALEVLVDAGSAAAHRGWSPSRPLMDKLISILQDFISRNILKADDAKLIGKHVPSRKA